MLLELRSYVIQAVRLGSLHAQSPRSCYSLAATRQSEQRIYVGAGVSLVALLYEEARFSV
jgi:hypothetical protein